CPAHPPIRADRPTSTQTAIRSTRTAPTPPAVLGPATQARSAPPPPPAQSRRRGRISVPHARRRAAGTLCRSLPGWPNPRRVRLLRSLPNDRTPPSPRSRLLSGGEGGGLQDA